MIYNLYIYSRKGKCLFYKEWNRPLNTLADDPEEDKKLMFGMLFSMKDLVNKLSPPSATGTEGIHVIKSNSFILHHFQSVSNMVFVMNTDANTPDLYHNLEHIYSNIFTEFVARNPLFSYDPDQPFDSPIFNSKLEEYINTLPCANSK